jgi:hypothetical protein
MRLWDRIQSAAAESPCPVVFRDAGRVDLIRAWADAGYRRGAEVGVWAGGFSERICQGIKGVSLLAVDSWRPYAAYRERKNTHEATDQAYRDALDRLKPYDCTLVRQASVDAATEVPDRSLDFVYIDANHEAEYVTADLTSWWPKVRAGGMLAGHDYRAVDAKPFIQVKPAVDAFTAAQGIRPWFVFAAERSPSWGWVVR